MPWNDQSGGSSGNSPGGDKGPKSQGPWGGEPRRPWGAPPSGGPQGPDLEDLMRQWRERFSGGNGGGRGGRKVSGPGGLSWPLIAGLLIAGWVATGVYIVDEGENAVITRLGKYDRTSGPGMHLHLPPPIEARSVINVTGQRTDDIGFTAVSSNGRSIANDNPDESLMITGDRNIVEIHFRVNYNISDALKFRFNVRNPVNTPDEPGAVRQVAESAMREVIGRRQLEAIITTERAAVEQDVQALMQQTLDEYDSGVRVLNVQLLRAAAPAAVIAAFNDVVNANSEAETTINNANRETARIVNEAQGYRESVVRAATGEAQRFNSVYEEYRQSPRVTRDRLYMETMERVLRDADTTIIDQRAGAVPYLPLDGIVRRNRAAPAAAPAPAQGDR